MYILQLKEERKRHFNSINRTLDAHTVGSVQEDYDY